jgi:RNA polymerase sigma-70 factor, ECF subfamily
MPRGASILGSEVTLASRGRRRARSHAMSDEITQSLDLVLRAQQGDQGALDRLCQRYYDRVRRIVRLRLGVRLREMCDSGDILQETFMAAVKSLNNFEMREEASLINWLSRLAEHQINAAADYHGAKKRDKRRNVSLSSAIGDSSSVPAASLLPDARDPRPLDLAATEEEQRIVEKCMSDLGEEYRELILLRNYAGASWETVAEETGRPSAAAARMMHTRAIVELAKLVRAEGVR